MSSNKIKSQQEIEQIVQELRQQGKKIATINGCFDILHAAHINILEKAKAEGDVLIILLNGDESVKRFKGLGRPIVPEDERAIVLSGLECVNYIVIFNEDKPLALMEKIRPHMHIKGGSFICERVKEERELLRQWGGELKNFELEEGFSTTNIIKKVLEKCGDEIKSN